MLPLIRGRIYLNKRDITTELPEKRQLGYAIQKPVLFPGFTVAQNLAFAHKSHITQEMIIERYLWPLNLTPKCLTQKAENLSGGEATRIQLIKLLLCQIRKHSS